MSKTNHMTQRHEIIEESLWERDFSIGATYKNSGAVKRSELIELAKRVKQSEKQGSDISIYFHMPFCARKCSYCDFYSIDGFDSIPDSYIELLIDDIDAFSDIVEERSLASVYIGGGTPSLLMPEQIEKLLFCVHKSFGFSDDREITVEFRPAEDCIAKIREFKEAGVNRLSLGIQSLDADVLKEIGRIQETEDSLKTMEEAQSIFGDRFSVDLLYGVAATRDKQFIEDIDSCIGLGAGHFSLYPLSSGRNRVFSEKIKKHEGEQHDCFVRKSYDNASRFMIDRRYKRYEISNFALNGKECLHNKRYWRGGDYLGIGAGAHGKLGPLRYRWFLDPRVFMKNGSEAERARIIEIMDARTRIEEALMLGLRTSYGIEMDKVQESCNVSIKKSAWKGFIEECIGALGNNLCIDEGAVVLKEDSFFLMNSVTLKVMEVFNESVSDSDISTHLTGVLKS